MNDAINAKGIVRKFVTGTIETPVLTGIDFNVKQGEFISIMGRSGAGKSTLLYQLSLLDDPNEGSIHLNGVDVMKLSREEKTKFRLNNLGYVFQDYALVPELTAVENVALPLMMRGIKQGVAFESAKKILHEFELDRQVLNLPSQLSGGEQQRVSIARSVVTNPKILFADEPTANLDDASARIVIDIFKELNRKGQTIVMVTHEEEYGKETDKIVYISQGLIEKVVENKG